MGIMYKLMKHRNLSMDLSTKPTAKTKTKGDKCRLLANNDHLADISSDGKNVDDLQPRQPGIHGMQELVAEDIEKRFTAEHILQLCKFLAEKSKGNKNLYKKQQSPKKITKSQKCFQFQPADCNTSYACHDNADSNDSVNSQDEDINGRIYVNDNHNDFSHDGVSRSEALPLLSQSQQQQLHSEADLQMTTSVLSSRLSPDINALNISSSSPTAAATAVTPPAFIHRHSSSQYHQQSLFHRHQQQYQHQDHDHLPHQQGKRDILLKIRHQIFERKRLREKDYEPQALNVNLQVWRPW